MVPGDPLTRSLAIGHRPSGLESGPPMRVPEKCGKVDHLDNPPIRNRSESPENSRDYPQRARFGL